MLLLCGLHFVLGSDRYNIQSFVVYVIIYQSTSSVKTIRIITAEAEIEIAAAVDVVVAGFFLKRRRRR